MPDKDTNPVQPPVVAGELSEILRDFGTNMAELHRKYHSNDVREKLDWKLFDGRCRVVESEAKAALLQREQRLVAEAQEELEAEGWMYVPPSYRDIIKKYVDSAGESWVSLAQLRHNTNTGKDGENNHG